MGLGRVPGSPFEDILGGNSSQAQKDWSAWVKNYKTKVTPDFKPTVKNTAFFIDDTGKLVATYDKRNLWHPER